MAYDLNGDHSEEVSYDALLSRSPTADPRDGRGRGGLLAPDRSSVPGQPVLRDPTVAAPPKHRLPPTQASWRREPGQALATGPGTAPGTGPTAARCHARGIAAEARRRMQHDDHLARPAPARAAAQEEDPSRRGAGPARRPGATTGILRGTGRRGPATAGLRGRVRGQHGDDPHPRPCPRG